MTENQTPVPQGQTNTMAIISLIAGILGLVTLISALCIPCLLLISMIIGIVGAILGFLAKKKIDESQGIQTGRGLAVGGLVTGLISGVCSIILIIIYIAAIGLIAGAGAFYPTLMEGY